MSSVFNSNPKPNSYNEPTLEDIQKAAEEVFGKESVFPRKIADNWWQLSPNCYGNDRAYEVFCKFIHIELQTSKPQEWISHNGIKISFK